MQLLQPCCAGFLGYVTSGLLGPCVLVSVCTSGDHLHGGGVLVIQEGISAPTESYLGGPKPKVEVTCADGMHGSWA